jgi:hypothetical protein
LDFDAASSTGEYKAILFSGLYAVLSHGLVDLKGASYWMVAGVINMEVN